MAGPSFDSDSDQSRYQERVQLVETRLNARFKSVAHRWDEESDSEVFSFSVRDENFEVNVPKATLTDENVAAFYIESNIDSVKGTSWKKVLLTPTEGIIPLE